MDLDENNLPREGFGDVSRLLNARDKASYIIDLMHYIVRFLIPSLASLQDEYKGFCDLYHARFSQGPQVFSNEIHSAFNALPEKTIAAYFYGYFIIQDPDEDEQHDLNPEWKTFVQTAASQSEFKPCIFCAEHVGAFDPAMMTSRHNYHDFHFKCYRSCDPSARDSVRNLKFLQTANVSYVFTMSMDFMGEDLSGIKDDCIDIFRACFSVIFDLAGDVNIAPQEKNTLIEFMSRTLNLMIRRDLSMKDCISRVYIHTLFGRYVAALSTPNVPDVIKTRMTIQRIRDKESFIKVLLRAIWTQAFVYERNARDVGLVPHAEMEID
jgi:hypothetical protein